MKKSETVRERVLKAVNAGMCHVDSVAIHADSSEAFVRRVLNELASDGEIQKMSGRAHHTYLPKGDTMSDNTNMEAIMWNKYTITTEKGLKHEFIMGEWLKPGKYPFGEVNLVMQLTKEEAEEYKVIEDEIMSLWYDQLPPEYHVEDTQ